MLNRYLIKLKKKHPSEIFYKSTVLINFTISTAKHLYEIFKNICVWLLLNWLCEAIAWNFVFAFKTIVTPWYYKNTSRFQTKALNKNFGRVLSIYLNPMLSNELRFCMFIIHNYYTKSKHLQSLVSLLKDVTYCLLFG